MAIRRAGSGCPLEPIDGFAVTFKGDISVDADTVAMFDAAAQALGMLTGVVANAGVVATSARLAEMSVDRMRRIFEVMCSALASPPARRREGCRNRPWAWAAGS